MKKLKILVFPCGSEIGLELYRSLRFAKEVELYGGSSVPDHGRFVYERHIGDLPFVEDPDFIGRLNRLIEELGIDYVIPAHDSVLLRLAEARHEGGLACPVITSPVETCRIARSKKRTMEVFEGVVTTPRVYGSLSEVTEYPVFLKPDVGQGSKGTVPAYSKEEAEFHLASQPDLLILEYLPGEEYTVDCYTDKTGELIFQGARQRQRISNGISVNTKPFGSEEIAEIAAKINARLPFAGMWFFQVKRSKAGALALMEIAPRLAGTMGMHRNLGVNFALMNIYELEGYRVSALPNPFGIEMDRALHSRFKLDIRFDHVYVDFDDCLLIDGKINTCLIGFLFQCLNEGVQVHLLTRHARHIHETLAKHRIERLFDSVVHLRNGEKKSSFIKHKAAIFIDDSFSERAEVSSSCKIPVFAPDAVESLLK
ncbi:MULTISPECIES: ATP-grasp domain-containing protein [Methylomicrobium]|uniref:Carbamoylphosphate synthase large subunit n=1 Tax=Methylomicrobium album BG8 TaxID=686340 RepID=H8GPA6_METAL|nr:MULTISPECIES: ATP-grasp domain-containing protein [Methylomicrobium]EIC29692.1 carbamoylphosphate synthase large subunit [Methylomicrobium album BG8]